MEENKNLAGFVGTFRTLLRGAKMRCPQCGNGELYQEWNVLKHSCTKCGYALEDREGDCWFFLYSTTAALTGVFIIIILLWRPEHILFGRIGLGVASACVIALSLPI